MQICNDVDGILKLGQILNEDCMYIMKMLLLSRVFT